jgi:hypothetical protein
MMLIKLVLYSPAPAKIESIIIFGFPAARQILLVASTRSLGKKLQFGNQKSISQLYHIYVSWQWQEKTAWLMIIKSHLMELLKLSISVSCNFVGKCRKPLQSCVMFWDRKIRVQLTVFRISLNYYCFYRFFQYNSICIQQIKTAAFHSDSQIYASVGMSWKIQSKAIYFPPPPAL